MLIIQAGDLGAHMSNAAAGIDHAHGHAAAILSAYINSLSLSLAFY